MPESIDGDDWNYQPSVRFWDGLIPKSKGPGGRMAPQSARKSAQFETPRPCALLQ
jgi:hypothetical protein